MSLTYLAGPVFQLGYVTNDVDAAVAAYKQNLGIANFSVINVGKAAGNDAPYGARIGLAWAGALMIELIQPIGSPAPFYVDDLAPSGKLVTRFNHVGVMVPETESWNAITAAVEKQGLKVAWRGSDPARNNVAYVDMRATVGHYVELIHMSPTMKALFDRVPRN